MHASHVYVHVHTYNTANIARNCGRIGIDASVDKTVQQDCSEYHKVVEIWAGQSNNSTRGQAISSLLD